MRGARSGDLTTTDDENDSGDEDGDGDDVEGKEVVHEMMVVGVVFIRYGGWELG